MEDPALDQVPDVVDQRDVRVDRCMPLPVDGDVEAGDVQPVAGPDEGDLAVPLTQLLLDGGRAEDPQLRPGVAGSPPPRPCSRS